MNCFLCSKYGVCKRPKIECNEFDKDSDVCDYCDERAEVNSEVILMYGPFHKGAVVEENTALKAKLEMAVEGLRKIQLDPRYDHARDVAQITLKKIEGDINE